MKVRFDMFYRPISIFLSAAFAIFLFSCGDGENTGSDMSEDLAGKDSIPQVDTPTSQDSTQDVKQPDTLIGQDLAQDVPHADIPTSQDAIEDIPLVDIPIIQDTAQESIDGSANLIWIQIPSGSFQMGCVPQDTNCQSDEIPRHTVTFVKGFEMTATEITQEQYQKVIGSNPSNFANCPTCPVEYVTWFEAKAFCEAVGGRLPSEAEWEYAARAGTETIYLCGDDPSCLDGIAWYYVNSDNKTHPVGQKSPNDFGLYDMIGNVWEWVEDWHHDNYDGAPSDGSAWISPQGNYRGLRGGSWSFSGDLHLRASARQNFSASDPYYYWGIRCVRD
jgi:formylglycine-generating enzyme required for sulfatase activity